MTELELMTELTVCALGAALVTKCSVVVAVLRSPNSDHYSDFTSQAESRTSFNCAYHLTLSEANKDKGKGRARSFHFHYFRVEICKHPTSEMVIVVGDEKPTMDKFGIGMTCQLYGQSVGSKA